jgi:hypothetical protein
MLISEKQIAQLINIASHYMDYLINEGGYEKTIRFIASLLDDINNQQSSELKEVK